MIMRASPFIMPGLVPGILFGAGEKDRRDTPGDDEQTGQHQ
jgi:hypothetical protein